jgi:hypothetical protein
MASEPGDELVEVTLKLPKSIVEDLDDISKVEDRPRDEVAAVFLDNAIAAYDRAMQDDTDGSDDADDADETTIEKEPNA